MRLKSCRCWWISLIVKAVWTDWIIGDMTHSKKEPSIAEGESWIFVGFAQKIMSVFTCVDTVPILINAAFKSNESEVNMGLQKC